MATGRLNVELQMGPKDRIDNTSLASSLECQAVQFTHHLSLVTLLISVERSKDEDWSHRRLRRGGHCPYGGIVFRLDLASSGYHAPPRDDR